MAAPTAEPAAGGAKGKKVAGMIKLQIPAGKDVLDVWGVLSK